MNITDLIKKLQEIEDQYGDIPVYTNGEYGINNVKELQPDMLTAGEVRNQFGPDDLPYKLKHNDIIVHIGGY